LENNFLLLFHGLYFNDRLVVIIEKIIDTVVVIRLTAFVTAFTGQLVLAFELSKLLPALALL
jgi:hypothetical protein